MKNDNVSPAPHQDERKAVIERFLSMIENIYPLVDKATFFLELKCAHSGINIAMANQRDFLSHFCTLLKDTSLTPTQMNDQASAAEEHLRRAVIESYQKAVELKLFDVLSQLNEYKELVLYSKASHPSFADAPSLDHIKLILKEVQQLREQGRKAKSRNKLDDKWEEGVTRYIETFLKLEGLENDLEKYLTLEKEIRNSRHQYRNKWLYVAVVSIAINIIAALFLFLR